jgi:hypothetical protein
MLAAAAFVGGKNPYLTAKINPSLGRRSQAWRSVIEIAEAAEREWLQGIGAVRGSSA